MGEAGEKHAKGHASATCLFPCTLTHQRYTVHAARSQRMMTSNWGENGKGGGWELRQGREQ